MNDWKVSIRDWPTVLTKPQGQDSELLVVLLHGFRRKPIDLEPIKDALIESLAAADIYVPSLPYSDTFSTVPAAEIASELTEAIGEAATDHQRNAGHPYKKIFLIGHSFGAVLARKIYICAWGEFSNAPLESVIKVRSEQPWVKQVDRIILLAALNRGWSISSRLSWVDYLSNSFFGLFGHLKPGQKPTIFDLRLGAPFVTQMRLQWLAVMNSDKKPNIPIIQLVGSIDDVVAPDEHIDLVAGIGISYLEMPFSNHQNIVEVDPNKFKSGTWGFEYAKKRRKVIQFALKSDHDTIKTRTIKPDHLVDLLPPNPDETVKKAVFVIHGIRDEGYWTQKIAREIKQYSEKKHGEPYKSMTAGYGYFAMLPFALPYVRRRKVEWMMDKYVDIKGLYPNAEVSYVGHSNGSYLLADALRNYPACRFKHVVFAGSVVRRDFDWSGFLPQPNQANDEVRINKVLNYVATADWVVAIFPKGLQAVKWFDLGSAGHDGFETENDRVNEVRYVRGSHSAGIRESQWDEISRFIVDGQIPEGENPNYSQGQNEFIHALGQESPTVLLTLLFSLIFFGAALLAPIFGDFWVPGEDGFFGEWWHRQPEWIPALGFLIYALILGIFISRGVMPQLFAKIPKHVRKYCVRIMLSIGILLLILSVISLLGCWYQQPQWLVTLGFILYLVALRIIATRV